MLSETDNVKEDNIAFSAYSLFPIDVQSAINYEHPVNQKEVLGLSATLKSANDFNAPRNNDSKLPEEEPTTEIHKVIKKIFFKALNNNKKIFVTINAKVQKIF